MYDIRIWEEVRDRVEWKKRRLSETIKKEITSDRSLQEFQRSNPVPWQLRQVMQQRAESWIQRLYDFCCEAYNAVGKAPSLEFDMAVWAYCIEPFMMREVEDNGYRASELLELLLCAVGSWPERRSLLRVSQKDCCVEVRNSVQEVWHARLLHLPSKWDQAARAIAHYNALERQTRRIAAPLPHDQARVSDTARATGARPEQGTGLGSEQPDPPQLTGNINTSQPSEPPAPAPVPVEPELQVVGEKELAAPAPSVVEGKWGDIEISFISDERVQVRRGKKFETLNYAEFGFEDARSGNPNRAWAVLRRLAEKAGSIENQMEAQMQWPRLEKRIQEIRSVFRERFGIASDPIPFLEKSRAQDKGGYNARFKISCARSYRS